MFTVHGTQKLLRRLGQPSPSQEAASASTVLGDWYATIVPWRRPVALFVNEQTLLPVLLPLAPSASLLTRFPDATAAALSAHNVDRTVVAKERDEMSDWRLAKTANRSVVGIMNEFTYLADAWREDDPSPDLLTLALRLSQTPCGPLYRRHVSPDRELAALLGQPPPG